MASAVLVLLVVSAAAAAAEGRRLICWEALLKCQNDPECAYAYGLYTEACATVLSHHGDPPGAVAARTRRCPSHCISALIQLNQTRQGPALEDCGCAQDEICQATKRAIEPCLPRSSTAGGAGSPAAGGGAGVLGCSEARRRCEWDKRCNAALARYLAHCGKLFNGMRCTHECRAVIGDMLQLPKALLLSDCVCDGLERPICEAVKENMDRLCFRQTETASGGYPPDMAFDEYDYDEDDDDPPEQPRTQHPPRRGAEGRDSRPSGGASTLTSLPTLLLLLVVVILLPTWTLTAPILL